ncbi:MAG: glycosyltransferase family 2 protein [bacterium]|nr:glycosyltransferase family 2 protein [bacterium]
MEKHEEHLRAPWIILVNHNAGKDILLCLRSVIRHIPKKYPILVVDNNSTDGSVEEIGTLFPDVRMHRNNENVGLAEGYNIGLRQARRADVSGVILLHPRTVAFDDFVTPLVVHHDAGIVGAILLWRRDGIDHYELGGKVKFPMVKLEPIQSLHRPPAYNRKIDYVSSVCMYLSMETIEKLGLFDRAYFFSFEDIDYCLRAKKNDIRLAIEPKALVFHQRNTRKERREAAAALYYQLRNPLLVLLRYADVQTKLLGSWFLGWTFVDATVKTVIGRGTSKRVLLAAIFFAFFDVLRKRSGLRREYQ